jgi:hypothetical protein
MFMLEELAVVSVAADAEVVGSLHKVVAQAVAGVVVR